MCEKYYHSHFSHKESEENVTQRAFSKWGNLNLNQTPSDAKSKPSTITT